MAWRTATFKDQEVLVEVDTSGHLLVNGGRVAIRWSTGPKARIYQASAARVTIGDGPIQDLPPGLPAGESSKKKQSTRGSGFGSAGSRTEQQARLAAAAAREFISDLPDTTTVCFTDGGCRGNPGPAGSGAVVLFPDGRRAERAVSLGIATNNIAELTAIGAVLDLLDETDIPPETPIALFTDSDYSHGVLCKGWKAKANTELIGRLRQRLEHRPGLQIHWIAGHVGIEGNERADALATSGVNGVNDTTWFTAE